MLDKSHPEKEQKKSCLSYVLILFLGAVGLCALLAAVLFLTPNTYSPLKEYPGANDLQISVEESYPTTIKTITFWTEDSPEQVYRFYRRQLIIRPFWRPREAGDGLSYSFSFGCPVGSYQIHAQQQAGRTYVTITLDTHVCI